MKNERSIPEPERLLNVMTHSDLGGLRDHDVRDRGTHPEDSIRRLPRPYGPDPLPFSRPRHTRRVERTPAALHVLVTDPIPVNLGLMALTALLLATA